jgi:hypothetical protein
MIEIHDCVCAIPAKPPREHGETCPVFMRWKRGIVGGVTLPAVLAAHLRILLSCEHLDTDRLYLARSPGGLAVAVCRCCGLAFVGDERIEADAIASIRRDLEGSRSHGS